MLKGFTKDVRTRAVHSARAPPRLSPLATAQNTYRPGLVLARPRPEFRWQPVSKSGATSGVLRAHVKSLPGTLEFRLRLVLLELTKRRPRVRKRIQPMRVEETRVNSRPEAAPQQQPKAWPPEQPDAPPRGHLFATSKRCVSRYVDGAPPMS